MKLSALALLLLLPSSAFASECQNPYLQSGIQEIKAELSRPKATAKPRGEIKREFTPMDILEYVPMSEDLGPEPVSPSGLAQAIPLYLQGLHAKNLRLTPEAGRRDITVLGKICDEIQRRGARPDSVDALALMSRIQKTEKK